MTRRLWLAWLLVAACHHRQPAPDLPARPEAPPPAGMVVPPPSRAYRLLATAESADQVALITFTPCPQGVVPPVCGARVARTYDVGRWPLEIEGPHGVVASPDGKSFYVSVAHGRPTGHLEKYDLATGRRTGIVELGMFPATVDVSPTGSFVYVINFNFEDPEMQPSSLSIVEGDSMTEIARPETCRMPHGSRLNPQGTRHYSGCMMSDLLVEVDARTMTVRRTFSLVPAAVRPIGVPDTSPMMSSLCSPTWAQPSADGARVYVACNRSAEIVAVDVASWRLVKRWKTPAAPYNLAATPDGRLLVATQKGPGTTTIWRLADDSLLAEIPGTRKIASGVAVSRDSRYAFVTLEGVGGDPGTVDVIDLQTLRRVASVDIGKQAGGIAILP